jgi:vacuolar-type H+-ATPase subunit F/Vma7
VSGGIYLVKDDGELVEMNERGYDTENLLQGYLVRYHDLLAGDQIDSTAPRRWLLVAREAPLASEEDGADRWSVDHLFLDQDAVPTIVEVERSTDTRIRREVVGQMLDYAANGVVYWSVDRFRAEFEANPEPEQAISDLLEDPDADPEEFWQKVKTNLQAGKVRLIFVSDRIPDELRRIVEFLNEQMSQTEVLAVEIKQYVSQDSSLRTLVPRTIGQTAKAQDSKSGGARSSRQWDETSLFDRLEAARGKEETTIARALLEWAQRQRIPIRWGKGGTVGSFAPRLEHAGHSHQVFSVFSDGSLEIRFSYMQWKAPFDEEAKRLALRDRLNEVTGFHIQTDQVTKRPWYYLSVLQDEADLKSFIAALDWFVREVKAT